MANNLAAQGFNICIVSRNEAKINEKINELAKLYTVKFKAVVADFAKMNSISDYQALIGDKLEDMNIGVLCANAGMGHWGPFEDLANKEVEEVVSVNALHPVYIIKVLLQQMLDRAKKTNVRCAIIITSSGLGSLPVPGCISYSASKSFSSFIAEGLNFELKEWIDVMSY